MKNTGIFFSKGTLFLLLIIVISVNGISLNAQGGLRPLEILSNMVHSVQRLPNGNTMLAVSYSVHDNEALEIAPDGTIIWRFNKGLNWAHCTYWCPKTNTVLIADTYNNRVIEVNRAKEIIWEYNDNIIYPNDADRLDNGNTLITVRDSNKIIEVTPDKKIVWEYTGVKGPHNADRLSNGNTIIANSMKNRIVEVNTKGETVWEYKENLRWPRNANRLKNGNTLIADSQHARVIEINPENEIVWEFKKVPFVYDCIRLDNGNTLLSANLFPAQALEVDPAGRIVWRWISKSDCKIHGFQYQPSNRVSYQRQRITELFRVARKNNVNQVDLLPIQQIIMKARDAFKQNRFNENSKLLLLAVKKLENMISSKVFKDFGDIEGYVFDSETNEAVAGAKVFIMGSRAETQTDDKGYFILKNIPVATSRYILNVEKQGFFSKQVDGFNPKISKGQNSQTQSLSKKIFIDQLNKDKYRNDYLQVYAGYLIEHLKKGKILAPYENSVRNTDLFPENIKSYLKLDKEKVDKKLVAFVENIVDSIPVKLKDSAEYITQKILEEFIKKGPKFDSQNYFPLDITAGINQLNNGALSSSSGNWLKLPNQTFSRKRGTDYELADLLKTMFRYINLPSRVAFVKDLAVTQWWSQKADGEGKWVTMNVAYAKKIFEDSGFMKALEYATFESEISFFGTGDKQTSNSSWVSSNELFWRKISVKPAYFLHNKTEFENAKFGLKNLKSRGFIAAKFDNFGFRDSISAYKKQTSNYEIFQTGYVFSLANLEKNQQIKVRFPVFIDNDFNKTHDVKIYCNRSNWVSEILIENIENCDTGEKLTYKTVTICPK